MKRYYYLINTHPKEGTTITRVEYVDIDEEDEYAYLAFDSIELRAGFQEWCK